MVLVNFLYNSAWVRLNIGATSPTQNPEYITRLEVPIRAFLYGFGDCGTGRCVEKRPTCYPPSRPMYDDNSIELTFSDDEYRNLLRAAADHDDEVRDELGRLGWGSSFEDRDEDAERDAARRFIKSVVREHTDSF